MKPDLRGRREAEIAEFLTRSPPPLENERSVDEAFKKAGGTTGVGLGKSGLRESGGGKEGDGRY